MAFTPITSDQGISYVSDKAAYRNASREALWGSPVYYCPSSLSSDTGGGYGGPRYSYGYNYDSADNPEKSVSHGNCTWWCCGRVQEACGVYLPAGLGNGNSWYSNYGGDKSTDTANLQAGDIISFSGGEYGHVAFVEKISDGIVYISQSAYSSRSLWEGYACRCTSYTLSELEAGNSVDMYKGISNNPYYVEVIGFLHTGEGGEPDPPAPPQTEVLSIEITPEEYHATMEGGERYLDFTFSIGVSGIPGGESVSGSNSYPGLTRVYNSGWSYTDYTVSGVSYRTARKRQTLRYERESAGAYQTVKHMYFNISKSTGSVYTDTPMYIDVKASVLIRILARLQQRRRKRGIYNVKHN